MTVLTRFGAVVAVLLVLECTNDDGGGDSGTCSDGARCEDAADNGLVDGAGVTTGGNAGTGAAGASTGGRGAAPGSGGSFDGGGGAGGMGENPACAGTAGSYPVDASTDPSIGVVFHHNHLGYAAAGPKFAVVEATGALSGFEVVRQSDGVAVFSGELRAASGFSEWGGAPSFYTLDFTCMGDPGTYTLRVNGTSSEAFDVAPRLLFERTIASNLSYFRQSRADDADVWAADTAVPFYGSLETRDVRGGWYDASGDISKYLSHLSYASYLNPQQIPLVAWALAWVNDEAAALLLNAGLASDVQAEALWGADYLLRVLDPAGFFYLNVFDGWSGTLSARRICAFTGQTGLMTADYPAAYREGGGMSIAALARIASWGVSGSFTAAQYLQGARDAFAHLEANSISYADDGRENVIDDYTALLAATELYAATSDMAYLAAARSRATSLIGRLSAEGYFVADGGTRPFWHASDAGLPVVALARYTEVEPSSTERDAATAAIARHLDYLVSVTNEVENPYGYARQHFVSGGSLRKSGFFIPHDNESGYWWQGENARLASLAAAALIGGRTVSGAGPLGVSLALSEFATRQLDWVLGQNPYDVSFLNGFGRNNPPGYCGEKVQGGTFAGGIANGITGMNTDGTGILWQASASSACWENWRWVEQWLPHAAWYMVAVTAAALGEG